MLEARRLANWAWPTMTTTNNIRPGSIVSGPTLPEPIEVLVVLPMGQSLKVIGRGRRSGQTYDPVLNPQQLAMLTVSAEREPFDGDARLFRLGIEAHRLGLAYEYDPFFSLSIARVDPLPHQLEAVYGYFLRLPRIRFLLADDPGAGKTIMAGLTLKELKARGLVKRVLIVTPANLTFQWQREMADKFREKFEVIRGATLRANYGQNPWQEHDQVITSVSWVSIVEDARESLLRSRWDLVIVDEAHKMSARSEDHTTYAYRLGRRTVQDDRPFPADDGHAAQGRSRALSPVPGPAGRRRVRQHREPAAGDAASRKPRSTCAAPRKPWSRFPTRRPARSRSCSPSARSARAAFDLDGEELDFYDELTRYVEDQSIAAAGDESARGRAVGFTMAMLQRRMASSVYAVRRSLERMRDRREKILDDPEKYRREQIERRIPDDFDDLDEEEQQEIIAQLEDEVLSVRSGRAARGDRPARAS